MVGLVALRLSFPLVAQATDTAPTEVDPSVSARLLAALAGLVILGFAMVLMTWLGSRATRRYMASGSPATRQTGQRNDDDWSKKPLDQD